MLNEKDRRLLAKATTNISIAASHNIIKPVMPNHVAWWLIQTLTDVLAELDNKEKELQQMNETFAQFKLIMKEEDNAE
jgi:hypothetical protein